MIATIPPALFLGNLDDPWVAEIAEGLPRGAIRQSCPTDLPDAWPASWATIPTWVIHRGTLTSADRERLARRKAAIATPPRVVLCASPHARYHQIDRWISLVDVLVPEAIAAEVIERYVATSGGRTVREGPLPRVAVVGADHELRSVLAAHVRAAGYAIEEHRDWSSVSLDLAIWDVPVLDPDWERELERRTKGRRVLAVLGFAERSLVRAARTAGARACLDSTSDPEDLIFVLDRLAASPSLPPGWRLRVDEPTATGARPALTRHSSRHRRHDPIKGSDSDMR